MGCMLRSDPMTQCDVFLSPDTAFMVLSELGEMGCVQFDDLNPELNSFQRTYVLEICRCAEMERKLRYIGDKMREDEIYIPKLTSEPSALELHEMNGYEVTVEKWERLLVELSANLTSMGKSHSEMSELSYVLTHIGLMLGNADMRSSAGLAAVKRAAKGKKSGASSAAEKESGSRLTVLTGLVQRKRSFSFQLMLFRMSRGNAFYKQSEEDQIFKDHMNNTDVRKVAFLLVVQGDELGARMKKVCEGFHCDMYPLPLTQNERVNSLYNINLKVDDLAMIMRETKFERCKAMRGIAKSWPEYWLRIKKAKAIYYHMNYFTLDITKKCLIGRCWLPTSDVDSVQTLLDRCSEKMETAVPSFMSKIETQDTPPTFHRTNRFTYGFQALISAYGDSAYRELNPGLYTIITFPFLFSLMFGDLGHGAIMLAAALWMLYNEKKFMADKSDSEIWNIFFGGRYIILLMSCFSIYAGIIYNDCFALSWNIFGTGWISNHTLEGILLEPFFLLEPKDHKGAYLIGRDPTWQLATNKILFDNSLKMKLSIIIGVIHMTFGLCLSLFNDIYFKKTHLIFLEFLPQLLFLLCIFMWLVILIFWKWFVYGGPSPPTAVESQGCAPLVLILFIDMVLWSTSKPLGPECKAYMFAGQQIIQKTLIVVAGICVPIMLFGPPCCGAYVNKKKRAQLKKKIPDKERDPVEHAAWEIQMEHASETFGDLIIHQAVHTIEYVLSTISHTASYLRLWALSLAHSQLSEMLWAMIFAKMALHDKTMIGVLKIVIVFAIWAFFTLAILVLMEGLSAFLHTLRLHWVEFMSKFFMGGGTMFKPFSFAALFSDASKDKTEVCPAVKTFDY